MVSISDSWRRDVMWSLVIAVGVMIFVRPAAADECEIDKFLASDSSWLTEFGRRVSISGNTAVIGASQEDASGQDSGAAYIYRLEGPMWVQVQKLLASDTAAHDRFGVSVAISGDVLVIGAVGDDDNGAASGSAYVYRLDGTTWIEEQKLLASDGAASDSFGRIAAISGNVAVIGAPNDDNENGISAGAAYIYRFNGSTWVQEQKLLASDGAQFDNFGNSAAVDGDLAVIRGQQDYMYRFNGSDWFEEQVLVKPGSGASFASDVTVSASGDTVVFGSPQDDTNGDNAGAAFIYRFDGSTWLFEQMLLASDGSEQDRFGYSVWVEGDTAVIGAISANPDSAYVFRFNGTTWIEEQKLFPWDGPTEISASRYR